MSGLLSSFVVVLLSAVVAALVGKRLPQKEARILNYALAAHVLAACAQVVITESVYGGGDMLNYHEGGVALARAMSLDFSNMAPEVVNLLFRREARLPSTQVPIYGLQAATGSMYALSAWTYFFVGPSIYPGCIFVAVLSVFGKLAAAMAFRDGIPERHRSALLAAFLLVPSSVFWSSGMLKESFAVAGLGFMLYGVSALFQLRFGAAWPGLVFGSLLVALPKPYILFAAAASIAPWVYVRFAKKRSALALVTNPVWLIVGLGVALVAVALLSRLFPEFDPTTVAEETARMQANFEHVSKGSSFELGNKEDSSFGGQAMYAPLALVTSMFRPFLFESKSFMIFVASIETTFILFLFVRVLWRHRWTALLTLILRSPFLAYSAAFVVAFGTPVGLATGNMGSLSRYRMPLIPFLVGGLYILDRLAQDEKVQARLQSRVLSTKAALARH